MFGEGNILVNLGRKRRGLLEESEKDEITWPGGVNMEKLGLVKEGKSWRQKGAGKVGELVGLIKWSL